MFEMVDLMRKIQRMYEENLLLIYIRKRVGVQEFNSWPENLIKLLSVIGFRIESYATD